MHSHPGPAGSVFDQVGMVLPEDERFMDLALEQAALAASLGEVPVGAVVVSSEQVLLAMAHNRREVDGDPTAHAELLAVRAASRATGSWRLNGCTVYVTLEPCAMCTGAMLLGRVSRCVYGATDPKGGFLGTVGDLSQVPALNHRLLVERGVRATQSSELLKGFFKRLREV